MNGGYHVTKIIYIITEAPLITAVLIARWVEGANCGKKDYFFCEKKEMYNHAGKYRLLHEVPEQTFNVFHDFVLLEKDVQTDT